MLSITARAEDLIEIYKLAAQNDTEFRSARALLQQQIEAQPRARARILPTLTLGADYNLVRSESTTEGTSGSVTTKDDYPSRSVNVYLTQPLYRADVFAQLDQAEAQVAQAEATFRAAEQALALRVAERYFEVLAAQDNLTVVKTEHESIGKQLEQTKQRFNVGLIAVTDVHEAQARFDLATAQLIVAENGLANSWEKLRELTGQPIKSLAPLAGDAPLNPPSPADVEQWVQTALKQNPSVQSAKFAVDAAEEQVRLQRGLGYPTLDLVGAYSNSDTSESDLSGVERTATTVGVELNWTIYNGGATSSATRSAASQLTQTRESFEQLRRNTTLQTREAYLGILANIGRTNALKQAVVSNKSALAATEAGYEVGTRTTVDVLNARTNLFLAQRDFTQSRYNYILATLRLNVAAGSLDSEDLQQVNGWLKK